ncbi:hypothetical protein HCH52_11145 [Oscillospiraceae bacterium HV4-5-C5C]|nr:hypothetical protein [Oscillospiraceae bacterium HV4-5-C5C]
MPIAGRKFLDEAAANPDPALRLHGALSDCTNETILIPLKIAIGNRQSGGSTCQLNCSRIPAADITPSSSSTAARPGRQESL